MRARSWWSHKHSTVGGQLYRVRPEERLREYRVLVRGHLDDIVKLESAEAVALITLKELRDLGLQDTCEGLTRLFSAVRILSDPRVSATLNTAGYGEEVLQEKVFVTTASDLSGHHVFLRPFPMELGAHAARLARAKLSATGRTTSIENSQLGGSATAEVIMRDEGDDRLIGKRMNRAATFNLTEEFAGFIDLRGQRLKLADSHPRINEIRK